MRQLFLKAVPLLITCCPLLFSCNREMYEYQVNIPWGGRIVALSKSPANDNDVMAAAQSGGLFVTTSGGNTWKHIQLPVFAMNDVKYSPIDRNVVIATCNKDLKTKNGGGIWHSGNGGKTWSHNLTSGSIGTFLHPYMNGYGISFEPGTRKVYVGTDYGLGISTDNGVNWNFKVLAPGDTTVYAVLATAGGRVLATTGLGIYRSLDGGNSWTLVSNAPCFSPRAFALVGPSANHVVVAESNYRIFYSSNFGQTWTEINSPVDRNRVPFQRREPFLRASSFQMTFFNAPVTVTQIFYGDGVNFFRKTIPNATASTLDFANGWDKITIAHEDPADIIFKSNGDPFLFAGDGGILSTSDKGSTWTAYGNSANGLNALQVNEANAQEYYDKNKKTNYVYFGTQDNRLWASADNGLTWSETGNEGHSIQTRRRALLPQGNLLTWAQDDDAQYYCSEQGFINPRDWKEPPGKRAGDPIIIPPFEILDASPQDRFFQLSATTLQLSTGGPGGGLTITRYNFNQTGDGGVSWKKLAGMYNGPTSQYPKAGYKTETVVYQPYYMATPAPNGWTRIGLVKVSGLGNAPGASVVQQADLNGFGGIGIMPTEFLYYNVFAVNPSNPDHIIIADVIDNQVKISHDAGKNWYAQISLTDIITKNGAFKFSNWGGISLVTHIAFNPDNPQQIAIGTRENGLFFSWNGGQKWYQLKNTTHITNISSITFYFDKTLLVSTYGRGLWKVEPKKSNVFTVDPRIPFSNGAWEWDPISGSIDRPGGKDQRSGDSSGDKIIAVDTSMKLNLESLFSGGKEFIETGRTRLRLPKLADAIMKKMKSDKIDLVPVRALQYNADNLITGVILSYQSYRVYTAEEIESKDRHEPLVQFYSTSGEPVTRLFAEDTVLVQGYYFPPAVTLRVLVNERVYEQSVEVRKDGSFQLLVKPPFKDNRLKITVNYLKEDEVRNVVNEILVIRTADE